MDRRANEELPPVSSLRRWGATAPSPRLPLRRPHLDDFYEVREQAPRDQNEPHVNTFHPSLLPSSRPTVPGASITLCSGARQRRIDWMTFLDTAKLATDESPSQCPVASGEPNLCRRRDMGRGRVWSVSTGPGSHTAVRDPGRPAGPSVEKEGQSSQARLVVRGR